MRAGRPGAVVAHRRADNINADFDSSKCCKRASFGLMIFLSAGLITAGFVLMFHESSAGEAREALMEPFVASAEAWTMVKKVEFEHSTFSIKIDYSGLEEPRPLDGQMFGMEANTDVEYFSTNEDNHKDVENYPVLKYKKYFMAANMTANQTATVKATTQSSSYLVLPQEWLVEPIPKQLAVESIAAATDSLDARVEVAVSDPDAADQGSGSQLSTSVDPWVPTVASMSLTLGMSNEDGSKTSYVLEQIPVGLARMTSNNFKSCRPRGGIHMTAAAGPHCTFLLSASRLCFVVKKDSAGKWQFDLDDTQLCQHTCAAPCHTRYNGTVMYIPQRTAAPAQAAAVGKAPMEILIRSADDPYLEAMQITNGTMDFGPSADDMHTEAIICLVLGIVLGFPAIVHFCVEWSDARQLKRYEPYKAEGPPPSAGPVAGLPSFGSSHDGHQRVSVDSEPTTPHAYVTAKDGNNGTPRIRSSSGQQIRA